MSKHNVRNAGIQVGHHQMDAAGLRSSAQAEPKEFTRKVDDLVNREDKPLRWQQVRNVKALQDALADVVVPAFDATNERSVDTSAFQALTSCWRAVDTMGAVDATGPERLWSQSLRSASWARPCSRCAVRRRMTSWTALAP